MLWRRKKKNEMKNPLAATVPKIPAPLNITTSSRQINCARVDLLCISLSWNWSPQLAANVGCLGKSEVLLVGFCTRLYCFLILSDSYPVCYNIVWYKSLPRAKSTSFGFLLVCEKFFGYKAYRKYLFNIYILICRQPSFVGSHLRCRNT